VVEGCLLPCRCAEQPHIDRQAFDGGDREKAQPERDVDGKSGRGRRAGEGNEQESRRYADKVQLVARDGRAGRAFAPCALEFETCAFVQLLAETRFDGAVDGARAGDEYFQHLTGPDVALPASGTITIVGPGTGLGVAHVWRDGNGFYHVQATEGGHLDFAPLDAVEDAILARLRQRHRRVSVERVVSGPAIVDIYETLAALEQRPVLHTDDRTIWTRGTAGEDTLMAAAIDRFCLSLGSAAGDLALAQGGSAVVIAGGLGLRIKDTILSSGFADRFRAKGRFESLMASLPVKLITHPQPGLLGAAAAFQKEHA